MLLKSTNPRDAKDEQELRQWLINELGVEDQSVVVEYIWDRYQGSNYVRMLADVVYQTGTEGRELVNMILENGKKPKAHREAEAEITAWFGPRIHLAVRSVKNQQTSAESAFTDLCWELEEKLRKMFPHIHRATMKGAMVSSFRHENGTYSLNVQHLIHTLFQDDPLKNTASYSWE